MPRLFSLLLMILISGCAGTTYYKGVTPDGAKAYLGPVPIEETAAFKTYLVSRHTDVDQQRYLFSRLKDARELSFLHDKIWYNSIEAYRGGMWLMRKRYIKGQNARAFIQKYVELSEAGNPHLVKYPDGTLQLGSYVLYNELDLLEEAEKKAGIQPAASI